ncbi:MAG: hypothetical protein AAGC70_16855 [Pseudomonadota bacterium]
MLPVFFATVVLSSLFATASVSRAAEVDVSRFLLEDTPIKGQVEEKLRSACNRCSGFVCRKSLADRSEVIVNRATMKPRTDGLIDVAGNVRVKTCYRVPTEITITVKGVADFERCVFHIKTADDLKTDSRIANAALKFFSGSFVGEHDISDSDRDGKCDHYVPPALKANN